MMLEGKVAMITGAGAGIGVEIAKRFVAEGAKICITGRRQNKLDETIAMLPAGTAVTCAGDVSTLEGAKRMVEATVEFGGFGFSQRHFSAITLAPSRPPSSIEVQTR